MDGPGARFLSTRTCCCSAGTLSQCLKSASRWASVSITQPTGCPAASLSCDKVPASLGQGCGSDPWQRSRIDQPCRMGLAACPTVATQDEGMAKCEAEAWGFLHTSDVSSPRVCQAAWRAGAVFLWARGTVAMQSGAVSHEGVVQHGNGVGGGSPCRPTFGSTATWPVLVTPLAQGMGTNGEVVH